MNLLISGCSFTHWPEEPGSPNNICWPAALQKKNKNFNITNLAEPGAGNQYIANSIVNAVLTKKNHYDLVLVMWSGVSRLDFLTDLTDPAWHQLFDDYGFYRRVEQCPNKLGYIFSGGRMGPWSLHPAAKRMFAEQYKVSDCTSLGYINLIEILKTQEFLKSLNIPYKFMSYVNYWTVGDHLSPNGDFGVMGYSELVPIVNSIDFSKWIFHGDRECIYDLAKANEDYHGDRFHPGITTHQQWADLVYQQITG